MHPEERTFTPIYAVCLLFLEKSIRLEMIQEEYKIASFFFFFKKNKIHHDNRNKLITKKGHILNQGCGMLK